MYIISIQDEGIFMTPVTVSILNIKLGKLQRLPMHTYHIIGLFAQMTKYISQNKNNIIAFYFFGYTATFITKLLNSHHWLYGTLNYHNNNYYYAQIWRIIFIVCHFQTFHKPVIDMSYIYIYILYFFLWA